MSQSGDVTPGVSALVSAQGYESVETLVTDRPEHGEYYLSPATVDRLDNGIADGELCLVVDGDVHPGQALDLRERLPSATVRDRRSAVWKRLAGGNPVAAARADLRECRIARVAAAQTDRDAAASGPGGSGGRRADLERRHDELRARLEERRQAASRAVADGYEGVDARVVLLSRPGAATAGCWKALTGADAVEATGRPAQPTTATVDIGPHTVAVTETPGVPGSGVPPWFETVVPGVVTAVQQADVVVGLGTGSARLVESLGGHADAARRQLSVPDAGAVRQAVSEALETATRRLRLPYGDVTHALVAELHDDALVGEVRYDDVVEVRVEVSEAAVEALTRRVDKLDGTVEPLEPD